MKTWQEIGFQREITRDGSLTLKALGETSEAMHHSGGALEETLFIYGEPLSEIFQKVSDPRIFSLGLGLGYVEMVTVAQALRSARNFELITMESEPGLVEALKAFLSESLPDGEIKDDFEFVMNGLCMKMEVSRQSLRFEMNKALQDQRWQIRGALSSESVPKERFHGLMYDAFSSKTSPALWTEDFLSNFFEHCTEPDAMVATYACTGNLKRSLKKNGFILDDRSGFQGKRSATLGRRGLFISHQDS